MEALNTNNEMQMYTVNKVLREMEYAEKYAKQWGAFWWEKCLDGSSLALDSIPSEIVYDLKVKYQNIYDFTDTHKYEVSSTGCPLKIVNLPYIDYENGEAVEKECPVAFNTIEWTNLTTGKSLRSFTFNSEGDISFSKNIKNPSKMVKRKNNRQDISYKANYNVLSQDFDFDFHVVKSTGSDSKSEEEYSEIHFAFEEPNLIHMKYNDLEITCDLATGERKAKLLRKQNGKEPSADLDVVINRNGDFKKGSLVLQTYKGSRKLKVNGTYRLDLDEEKGIQARFISRKGIKLNLFNDLRLLGNTDKILYRANGDEKNLVTDLVTPVQTAILSSGKRKEIIIESSEFNMEVIKKTEEMIIELIKMVKGELPLEGLQERIDSCLNLMEKSNRKRTGHHPFALKLIKDED